MKGKTSGSDKISFVLGSYRFSMIVYIHPILG